jgi:thiol-disulfide isomerase/thioredoxin
MNSSVTGRIAACGLAYVAVLCCVPGCTDSPTVAVETAPAVAAPATSATPDRVEITLVDRAGFDAVLAGLHGKVVLVDGWATWCAPCVEQLPHSVERGKERGPQGLAVVTVNFDDSDATDAARKILETAGAGTAGVINLQSKLGGSSESMDAFEIASGALPHYKLYDRQGKLRQTFELDPTAKKQFTPEDVDSAIAKLLAE